MKNSRKGFIPLVALLIIALAVIVGGGAAVYMVVQKGTNPQQPGQQSPAQQTAQGADTSNWQIYSNGKYGFEFKYPRDWMVSSHAHLGGEYPQDGGVQFVVASRDYTGEVDSPGTFTSFTVTPTTLKTISELLTMKKAQDRHAAEINFFSLGSAVRSKGDQYSPENVNIAVIKPPYVFDFGVYEGTDKETLGFINSFRFIPPSSVQPSITVLSPNGGERYRIGETVTIKWTAGVAISAIYFVNADNSADRYQIYSQDADSSGVHLYRTNQGAEMTLHAGKYYVEIYNQNKLLDRSDAPFTITSATQ